MRLRVPWFDKESQPIRRRDQPSSGASARVAPSPQPWLTLLLAGEGAGHGTVTTGGGI